MKMNKMITTGLLTLGLLAAAGTAMAVEAKPEADLTVGIYSKYVWRGWTFSKDSLVIQPGMSIAYNGFGFGLWGNVDTSDVNAPEESMNMNELDITLSYDGSINEKTGYSLGYIYYDFDGAASESQELYAGLSFDTILSPSITVYKEITGIDGYYVSLGIGHSLPINEKTSLDLGASIGYYDDQADYNEFHDGLISASVSFPVTDYVTITPELYFSFALSGDASDALEAANLGFTGENDSSFVYGGVSASFAF
jgi:uncharacterized protein (TIGR02001 family)